MRIPKPGIEERRPLSIPANRDFRHILTLTESKCGRRSVGVSAESRFDGSIRSVGSSST